MFLYFRRQSQSVRISKTMVRSNTSPPARNQSQTSRAPSTRAPTKPKMNSSKASTKKDHASLTGSLLSPCFTVIPKRRSHPRMKANPKNMIAKSATKTMPAMTPGFKLKTDSIIAASNAKAGRIAKIKLSFLAFSTDAILRP